MRKNVKSIAVVLIFVISLMIPVLTIRWTGSEYSEAEKRTLAAMPVVFTAQGTVNPTLWSDGQLWLEDHIGLREYMVEAVGWFKLHLMNRSPSEAVQLGSKGWYFYTRDNNIDIALGKYPLTDEMLEQMLHNMLMIREKLSRNGIEFVLILPPSKVSVYPEYLRRGSGRVTETPVDSVADYLEAHSDLKVVRLKEALLAKKEEQQVFFKADTHWNDVGAYAAYEKIIQDLQAWELCGSEPAVVALEEGTHLCDLTLMMGQSDQENTLKTRVVAANAVRHGEDSARYQQIKSTAGASTVYHYSNETAEDIKGLFFGDSMFGSWNATELMAENFSEFTYVWNYNIQEEIVNAADPDVVFLEMTERGIYGLAAIQFAYIQNRLQVDEVAYSHEAEILKEDSRLYANTIGNTDPQIVLKALETAIAPVSVELQFSNVEKPLNMQLYYAAEEGAFSEENSICFTIVPGQETYLLQGFHLPKIKQLRLDFANEANIHYVIESVMVNYSG